MLNNKIKKSLVNKNYIFRLEAQEQLGQMVQQEILDNLVQRDLLAIRETTVKMVKMVKMARMEKMVK